MISPSIILFNAFSIKMTMFKTLFISFNHVLKLSKCFANLLDLWVCCWPLDAGVGSDLDSSTAGG